MTTDDERRLQYVKLIGQLETTLRLADDMLATCQPKTETEEQQLQVIREAIAERLADAEKLFKVAP